MSIFDSVSRLTGPNTVNRRRLHGSVAHELALMIIGGELKPGEVLPNEDTLSATLNVSRTAYREGIRTLAAKGLVRARPKLGTTVNERAAWNILDGDVLSWYFEIAPDPAFIRSLFGLRRIVEPGGAALAAECHNDTDAAAMRAAFVGMATPQDDSPVGLLEADLAFHHAILKAAGNEALLALSSAVESTLRWSVRLKMSAKPKIYEATLLEHERVLTAILSRQADEAASLLRALVDKALKETLEALQNQRFLP